MWKDYHEVYQEMLLVEDYIKKNIQSRNSLLTDIAEELVEAGGKRLRPAFVILSSKFGEYNREKVMAMAAAIEILHTATLVHDDVVDKSELRRGRSTVSHRYGVDMAVYTGDFLFTKAVLMLAGSMETEKLDMIARAIKTICEGEVDQYQDRFNHEASALGYLKRVSRKTAVLFGAACGIGAYGAGCSHTDIRNLVRFGTCYGVAFQIRDDINDFTSDKYTSGKPVGSDLHKGVVTLPVIYAMAKNSGIKDFIVKFSLKEYAAGAAEVMEVVKLVMENGGIEASGAVLDKYINKGLNILQKLPQNEYSRILAELIGKLRL